MFIHLIQNWIIASRWIHIYEGLASRQMSVLALYLLMRLEEMMNGHFVCKFHIQYTYLFNELRT